MTGVTGAETMKAFNKGIVDEFRANGGVVGGPFEGGSRHESRLGAQPAGQPDRAHRSGDRRV
jgi:hypothetical protein